MGPVVQGVDALWGDRRALVLWSVRRLLPEPVMSGGGGDKTLVLGSGQDTTSRRGMGYPWAPVLIFSWPPSSLGASLWG